MRRSPDATPSGSDISQFLPELPQRQSDLWRCSELTCQRHQQSKQQDFDAGKQASATELDGFCEDLPGGDITRVIGLFGAAMTGGKGNGMGSTGRIEGKVACVTGAASGIGRASATLMATQGARVVLTDRDAGQGSAVAAAIAGTGACAVFLPHDVTSEEAWIGVVAAIRQQFGRLDILVNNAGIGLSGPVVEMALADWRRQVAVNLDGTFLGVKHALPLMREGGGGSIVNVSSIAGIRPSPNAAGYSATKAAVRAFTKSVALECAAAGDGVRVNSVHPGIVETAIWDSLIGTTVDGSNNRPRGATLDAMATASIPLRRTGTVDEIAEAILWLASDAAAYVTGAELVVDGGRSIA